MESERVDEIPEYSIASLHADGTENVLNKKDELLTDNSSEKETKLTSNQVVVDAPGQVVPAHSSSYLKPETEASQNNERSTVPQGTVEVMDCREESEHFSKQSKIHQHKLLEGKGFEQLTSTPSINCESMEQENAMKTFLWPPIGFKDQITEQCAPVSEPDTFEQVVLRGNDENNDITIAEQVPIIININQSEEHSSQEENKLTSILKKNDSGLKKTVHFPKNIVSVKFYEISDEEDSDNDTVILSDPEEDDLRDQEVPFNTYGDYDSNCCHPSSTSMNFIPPFTFPPVLKLANCQLYEDIDDHDEQIMAIMEDDDGRERLHANDLAADEIYHQEDISGFEDDPLTSQEVITLSKNSDDVVHEERKIAPAGVRKVSKHPEEELEIMETQAPLIKNGIERNEDHLEVNAYKNMNGTFEFEILEVNQRTPAKDKTLFETPKDELEVDIPLTQSGIEPQNINEHQNDQLTSIKVKTVSENPEEIEMNAPVTTTGIERLVIEKNTNEYQDDKLTSNEITSSENLAEDKEIIEVQTLTTQNEVGTLEEDLEIETNKYVDETLESESSVVKDPSVLATFNQGIENPAVIYANSSCVNNETHIKVPKVNAPELDAKVYTLLDALKATPKNSIAVTMEERSTEENWVQQATSPERFLEGTMASINLLPESQIPEFNAQRLDKMQTELTGHGMVKEWLTATQTPDIVLYDETSTMSC